MKTRRDNTELWQAFSKEYAEKYDEGVARGKREADKAVWLSIGLMLTFIASALVGYHVVPWLLSL